MAGLSNTWEDNALDYVLGTDPASNRYLALMTATPTDTTLGTEVSTGGGTLYARQLITFDAASGGATQNAATVTFPTAGASWGTVTHWAVCEADVEGVNDVVVYGAWTASKTIAASDVFEVLDGELDITAD